MCLFQNSTFETYIRGKIYRTSYNRFEIAVEVSEARWLSRVPPSPPWPCRCTSASPWAPALPTSLPGSWWRRGCRVAGAPGAPGSGAACRRAGRHSWGGGHASLKNPRPPARPAPPGSAPAPAQNTTSSVQLSHTGYTSYDSLTRFYYLHV